MRPLRNLRTTLAAALFLIPAPSALAASDEPLTSAIRTAVIDAVVSRLESTYVDVAVSSGSFEAAFGPAPNNYIIQQQLQSQKGATTSTTTRGDSKMRLRADRFFSNIPYQRMVTALSQLTAIPDRQQATTAPASDNNINNNETDSDSNPHARICMDELLRDVILTTHAYSEPFSSYYGDNDFCDLNYLVRDTAAHPKLIVADCLISEFDLTHISVLSVSLSGSDCY